jgi:acetyltransferase-like isoleucine patch superfamily enzyme
LQKTSIDLDELVDMVAGRVHAQWTLNGPLDRLLVAPGVKPNNTMFNTRCGTITVGKGTHFSFGVMVLAGSHDPTDPDFPLDERDRSIVIGEGCWLASGCIILGPCKIGDGCVIGAGAVVTKDCEPGWLYVGVPAVKKKKV